MTTPRKQNLMKRMLKRAARARHEHGVALLFTLCILSMALITAVIFSTQAMTSRKVAAAYAETSSARILADGAVGRALLSLLQSDKAYACSNYKTNAPSGNANEYSSDWIWKIEQPGVYSFDDGPIRFSKTYYDREKSTCPSWEYVYSRVYKDSSTQQHIIGRYAYVAIGLNDQLNPNAIGNREGVDPAIFAKRLGRWTSEPQFIFKSSKNNWDYSSKISPETIAEKYSAPKGWSEIDLFVDELTGNGSSATDRQLKMMADQYFDVSGSGDYNKFRADGKAVSDLTDYELSNGESYRFPLIRSDWESISVEAVKNAIPWFRDANASQANVDQAVANLINYNASPNRLPVTNNGDWIGGTPSYTGNKRTPYINEAHADVLVSGKLGMRLAERYLSDPSNSASWKYRVWYTGCNYSRELTLNIETVNMYNDPIQVQAPKLVGEVNFEYWNPNGDNAGFWQESTFRFDTNTPWEVSSSDGDSGYRVYTYILDEGMIGNVTTPKKDGYDKPHGHEADFFEFVKIRNVRLSLDRVLLYDNGGRNADLSLMNSQLQNGNTFPLGSEGAQVAGVADRHFYFDAQVNDPRFNLGRDQWSAMFSEQESGVNETIGHCNNTINLGSVHDNENRSDPAYAGADSISTAYIRHGQMISLWELGAIHRGAPWQTINLKCAAKGGIKMERYELGDGHLLDQIALTESTDRKTDDVIGLINLNCVANFGGNSAPFVFKSLFTEFPIYETYANMNSGSAAGGVIEGESVDSSKTGNMDADTFAKELSESVSYASSSGFLPRRTAVFPTEFPSSDNRMQRIIPKDVPDAQSEEIFCRVVNLLKWNKQQIKRATVLVLAQSILDVAGNPPERNLSDKPLDLLRDAGFLPYSATSTGRNTMPSGVDATNVRSTYSKRSAAFKQYDNFYDQITGEAKVLVRLEWDESANNNKGAWKITRKEYAE